MRFNLPAVLFEEIVYYIEIQTWKDQTHHFGSEWMEHHLLGHGRVSNQHMVALLLWVVRVYSRIRQEEWHRWKSERLTHMAGSSSNQTHWRLFHMCSSQNGSEDDWARTGNSGHMDECKHFQTDVDNRESCLNTKGGLNTMKLPTHTCISPLMDWIMMQNFTTLLIWSMRSLTITTPDTLKRKHDENIIRIM